jgi:hypothetical protein
MERMTSSKLRHIPVIERDQLVGIVSIGDIVKHRLCEMEQESAALRDYIRSADPAVGAVDVVVTSFLLRIGIHFNFPDPALDVPIGDPSAGPVITSPSATVRKVWCAGCGRLGCGAPSPAARRVKDQPT